jgi:polyisoprenoid-binding protein YceI
MTETTTTTPAARQWNGIDIPAAGTFAVDPQHSNVGFVATHMMFTKVRGHFADVSGTVTLAEDPTQSSIEVTIKTASVTTGSDDRDGHLRSGDFFDVETYPEMTFRSTEVRHLAGSEFVVIGDLTIRDVTKPVELAVTFEGSGTNPWGAEVAGVSARAEVNREDWGLTWNAALETGGVLVGKKVVLEIEVQAARA